MPPRQCLLPTLLVLVCACSERELPVLPQSNPQLVLATPRTDAGAAAAVQDTAPRGDSATAVPEPSLAPLASAAPPASARSNPTATETSLLDEQGKPLPQTDELPPLDSPAFVARMQRLLQAIDENRPELADGSFFPVVAYEQVKDIASPARDHKYRLMTAYRRNIEAYHRKLKHQAHPLKFLSVEASRQSPRWMKPGSEGNKLGYHRMLRAQLKYGDATGAEHRLEITSLISWRGEWYVVHLDGFK